MQGSLSCNFVKAPYLFSSYIFLRIENRKFNVGFNKISDFMMKEKLLNIHFFE
jgi:hypothetical protein